MHVASTSTGRGGEPGGGSVGRSIQTSGGACGFRRPDPACRRLSTRPSSWRTRKKASGRRCSRSFSVNIEIWAAASVRTPAATSVITTASTNARTCSTSTNDSSGTEPGAGKLSPIRRASSAADGGAGAGGGADGEGGDGGAGGGAGGEGSWLTAGERSFRSGGRHQGLCSGDGSDPRLVRLCDLPPHPSRHRRVPRCLH